MASVHRKLKLAFIHPDPEGPRLSVRARDNAEILDMYLSPGDVVMLQKQLAEALSVHLRANGFAAANVPETAP